MKKLSIILLMVFFSGCAGLEKAEQTKAQFGSYYDAGYTPADTDIMLAADVSDSNAVKGTHIEDLPISTAAQTALDSKIDSSNTVNYTTHPIATWGSRTDYAECDSIYQAINDSAIDFDELPDSTTIIANDNLILQKNDGTTEKIDALLFKTLINEDLFGSDTVIVTPEDNLLEIITTATLPNTFLLTQGTHTIDVTAHSSFLDLTGARFIGYGKGQTFLNIVTREGTVSKYIKLNGVCYFKDLSIDISSTDVGNDYHFLNDTADAYLYFLNCDVVQSTDEPYYFFGQSDNTKVFNLYIKNSTFLNDFSSFLFLTTTTPQLKLYAANSSIGCKYVFNNATSNVLKADNCTFTGEIQFLNLDTNTIDYYLSDVTFRVKPVTSGEHAGYNILIRGNTNYVLPTSGGGLFWEFNMPVKMGISSSNGDTQYIPFEYWNLAKTSSVTEKHRVNSQPVFSFNINVTSATNLVFYDSILPFDMIFYVKAGSNDLNIATGYSGGDWTYTLLPPETLTTIKTVPCPTAFPTFPSSASDTRIQRQVISW
jgi:hypothetical protein